MRRANVTVSDTVRVLRLHVKDGHVCGAFGADRENGKSSSVLTPELSFSQPAGFCRIYEFSSNTSDIGGDGIAHGL